VNAAALYGTLSPRHCSTISTMGKRNKGKVKKANKERQAAAAKEQQEALEAQIAHFQIGGESTDVDLVRYCSDECQKDHIPQHNEASVKRAAGLLRDELLFRQPESTHLGDCPICCLPMPLDLSKSTMMACCSKLICNGCNDANQRREAKASLEIKCVFCREPAPSTDEEVDKQRMKRIEMNDPAAMCQKGSVQFKKGDYSSAFEYFTKAAVLGEMEAHCRLAGMYYVGQGVEKDRGKQLHHLEEAAIGGDPKARYTLGCHEGYNGSIKRAVRHWIIAAKLGCNRSIKPLMDLFQEGYVSKDDLAAALRAHQAAVDATKSPQREAAKIARI